MRKRRDRKDSSVELQLTPMIDVVFLLLIFFMITAKFVLPECKIPAFAAREKRGGGTALVREFELHIIKDAAGNTVVTRPSGIVCEIESPAPLLKELRNYRNRNLVGGELSEEAGVAIQCEDDIRWEAVVKVLDVIRDAEIPGIRFKQQS